MTAAPAQQVRGFTADFPCPICGGHERLHRGHGARCHGFLSTDGRFAHCSREEHAGSLEFEPEANTYAHRLDGPCRCGKTHTAGSNGPSETPSRPGRIVAKYVYTDGTGRPLSEVRRWDPKGFSQARIDPSGNRITERGCMRGVPRVPYRLPEVLAAVAAGDRIYICEGEKDAERANAAGLVATTNPGGAGKWRPEYAEFLRGADVTIVRDRDEKGRHHADEVAKSLEGVARSVQIVEAKAGKDLSDHLDAGLTVGELVDVTSESPVGAVREEPDSSGEHLTDLGNARRFCALHGREVRYSHPERSWYVWDGRRWQRDETAGIERLAKEVPGAIYQEAAAADPEEREALAKWALRSESRDRIRAMLDLAASEPGIPVHPEDFDRDPDVLNLLNGTLALRTQQLRPHRREDLLTKLSPVEWNPDAHSELWERFQEKALPDPSARRFAQKAAGATLLGRSGADVVILIHGPTRTGKGTKQNAISSALGDYAVTAGLEDFAERDRAGGARPELVRLRGARMVSVYETSRRLKLSASLVKTLSGSAPSRCETSTRARPRTFRSSHSGSRRTTGPAYPKMMMPSGNAYGRSPSRCRSRRRSETRACAPSSPTPRRAVRPSWHGPSKAVGSSLRRVWSPRRSCAARRATTAAR